MLNFARQVFIRSAARIARDRDTAPAFDIPDDVVQAILDCEPEVPGTLEHVQSLMNRIPFQRGPHPAG